MSELSLDKSHEVQESIKKLTQRQALFNAYFAAAKTGMGIFDTQFRYIHINEALAELNGVPASDHIGRKAREVLPEVGPTIEAILQSILDTGQAVLDYELVGETPKQPGVTRYWLVSYNPLFDDNGIIFGIGVIVLEISDRKKAEIALSESEERSRLLNERLKLELEERKQIEEELRISQASFAGIVEIADDAIITINSSQNITLFNQGAERIFGYAAAEVIGQPLSILMPTRLSSIHQQHVVNFGQLTNQARQMAERREIFGQRKDGEEFLAEVSISQLEVQGEKLFTAILRDISDRKRIEVALRDNESRLRQFVEFTPIAIAMFDQDLRYIVASQQWLKEFNLSRDIIGLSHYEVFPDVREDWKQIHQRCLAGAVEKSDEDPFPRADGSTMWLRWGIYPWYTPTTEIGGIIMYSEDITKRKQAEEYLRQKEAEYRCIFESVSDGIAICDLETGKTIAANPAQAKIHGYTLEEYTQLEPGSQVHPNSHHLFAEFLEAVKQGKQFFCQAVDICKDGTHIDVEVTASPYWQDDKLYALAVTRDISDRKKVEKALSESEERFRSLMEASAQIVWNTNAQGELVTEQPTWSAFTGQTFEQYKGWGWLSTIHPDDSAAVDSQWTNAVANRSLYEVEFRMRRYDGEYRYMSSRGVPILQADGTIREWMGANTDITERKLAETALQTSEERYRSLIKATSQIVWTTDAEGRTTELGDWSTYTGQSLEEMADYGWGKAIHPEDREYSTQAWVKALQTKSLYETEFRVRGKDGNYRYFATKGVPILDENGNIREWMGTCTDIHDRKQAEIALQKSEERYRSLVTATSQIPWLTDVEGRVTDMPEWREFTGQSLAEVAGFGWLNAIHPEDSERTAQVWMHSVETKTLYETEYRIRAKDGSYRYFLSRGVPVLDQNGSIREWVGTCSDIHDRKQAEIAQQQSEERYRCLTKATSQMIWMTDPEGRLKDTPDWRNFTGQTEAEIVDFGWLDAVHPDDRQNTAQVWSEAVQTRTLYEVEYRIRAANGDYRYFIARGVPVLNENGSIREWIGTCADIHDRKLAEQKVRQTLDLLDLASDAVIVRDMSDRIIYWNRGAENLYGWKREEVFGQYIHTFLATSFPKALESILAEFIEQGSWDGEITHTTRNGEKVIVGSRWTLQRDELGKPSAQLEINTNITERKLAELALAQAKDAAEAASRAKSEFLANMSHELRTPLNGILGYAQVLQRSRQINAEERSRIDVIYQCGSHLLTLINDILDLSKIEAQKVELLPSDFHFPAFLQGVAEMCRVRAELKGIQLHYQFASELPLGIRADEKRLRQVLINLLSNAIKFTDSGSVNFTIAYASEDKIRFEVRDTGVGIAPVQIQAIFQPFEQAGDVRRQTEGTGLGLAISQKIVELMGSRIQVQSEVGVGSIFWFDVNLPQAIEWVKAAQTDAHGQIIGIKDCRPKVLVIDDKWENRSVVNNLLSPIGFDVYEAIDGQEGWYKVLEMQPDLVITDLLMPKLNGFELIKRIRESDTFKDLVIIVSSASVFEADQYKSIEAGGNEFLAKPIQATELLQKIQKQLQLEWIYEERKATSNIALDNVEVVAPPKEELNALYELAMKGNFKGIIKQAALLEEQAQKYLPFAQKLRQMAKEFQDEKILAFIQSYK